MLTRAARKKRAKVQLFSDSCKYFLKKIHFFVIFLLFVFYILHFTPAIFFVHFPQLYAGFDLFRPISLFVRFWRLYPGPSFWVSLSIKSVHTLSRTHAFP